MKNSWNRWTRSMLFVFAVVALIGCAKKTPETGTGADAGRNEASGIVVARVNGVAITMDSLVRMMNRMPGAENRDMESVKQKALDRLIMHELAYQKAKATGIIVDKSKIDIAMSNLRQNVGGEKEYAEYLKQQNVTEQEVRAEAERGLTLELIYAKEVLEKVVIPEALVLEEYEKEKSRYILPEKVVVTDVMFLPQPASAANKKARAILRKIKSDPDQNPWNLVLDGSFIVRKIEIRQEKDPELYKAAKKLSLEQLSGVIKAADGLHIVKLKSYAPERQATFDEVKPNLENKFRMQAQEKRNDEWQSELRQDAKIEIPAVDESGVKQ